MEVARGVHRSEVTAGIQVSPVLQRLQAAVAALVRARALPRAAPAAEDRKGQLLAAQEQVAKATQAAQATRRRVPAGAAALAPSEETGPLIRAATAATGSAAVFPARPSPTPVVVEDSAVLRPDLEAPEAVAPEALLERADRERPIQEAEVAQDRYPARVARVSLSFATRAPCNSLPEALSRPPVASSFTRSLPTQHSR